MYSAYLEKQASRRPSQLALAHGHELPDLFEMDTGKTQGATAHRAAGVGMSAPRSKSTLAFGPRFPCWQIAPAQGSCASSSSSVGGAAAGGGTAAVPPTALAFALPGADALICRTATKSASLSWRARFFKRERRFSAFFKSLLIFSCSRAWPSALPSTFEWTPPTPPTQTKEMSRRVLRLWRRTGQPRQQAARPWWARRLRRWAQHRRGQRCRHRWTTWRTRFCRGVVLRTQS